MSRRTGEKLMEEQAVWAGQHTATAQLLHNYCTATARYCTVTAWEALTGNANCEFYKEQLNVIF